MQHSRQSERFCIIGNSRWTSHERVIHRTDCRSCSVCNQQVLSVLIHHTDVSCCFTTSHVGLPRVVFIPKSNAFVAVTCIRSFIAFEIQPDSCYPKLGCCCWFIVRHTHWCQLRSTHSRSSKGIYVSTSLDRSSDGSPSGSLGG